MSVTNNFPVILDGGPVTADEWFNPVGEAVTALQTAVAGIVPALTDFSTSFTLTAPTTSPTKGNSTYVAKYAAIGKLLYYSIKITIGSTFSAGSGDYSLLVPFNMDTTITQIVPAIVTDSGTAFRVCQARPIDATHLQVFRNDQAAAIGSAGPGTAWATGDVIEVAGMLWLA